MKEDNAYLTAELEAYKDDTKELNDKAKFLEY